ncbi:MAG: hypothetical protein AAF810_05470 [Cyanobacteria bacterium P01_D01_bin.36]
MMKEFDEYFIHWNESGMGEQSPLYNSMEVIESLLKWFGQSIKDDYKSIEKGYEFPAEIQIGDGWTWRASVAFDIECGRINVFWPTDTIGSNIISLNIGEIEVGSEIHKLVVNIFDVLNFKLKEAFGLN